MKISLLHPSRGRGLKAKTTYDYWMSVASGKVEVEHILSIDHSDDDLNKELYLINFRRTSAILLGHNDCVVQAANFAAKVSTGDILIYLSDDFKCPSNWDLTLSNLYFHEDNKPRLWKVDDCLQPFDVGILTIPIMNRQLYQRLGYFLNPAYKSMFVDEDLYWTCYINGWLSVCPELKFPHEHNINGLAERDETYIRSEANWNQGKAMFAERKALNFPL